MRLAILHPLIAARSCKHCQEWKYDEETRLVELQPGTDEPLPRDDPNLVPCKIQGGSGCPKGSPDAGIELNPRNRRAYEYHKECRAVGKFPDDSIVRRNAAIIEDVEESCRKEMQDRRFNTLAQALLACIPKIG